jgi:hypothetical protein
LADVALLGSTREIKRSRQGHEVPDLLHFHRQPPSKRPLN